MCIDKKLYEYSKSGFIPMHMPGHMRRRPGEEKRASWPDPYSIDITEINGFDNLNRPCDIYVSLQKELAGLYHCDRAYISVGGSTCGNLAMIYTCLHDGDHALTAADCHKSVWHGLALSHAIPLLLDPVTDENGISMGYDPKEINEYLEKDSQIKAVIITSPTYEGVESDIPAISDICKKNKVLLIVDAAHGAHSVFSDADGKALFCHNPIEAGADMAVVSLHKTLPALTQTACILLNESNIYHEDLEESIRIFQTSSPSYVLTSSVSECLSFIKDKGAYAGERFFSDLKTFYEKTSAFKSLRVMKPGVIEGYPAIWRDPTKIVIITDKAKITGKALSDMLRDEMIECEMAMHSFCLAMTSVATARSDLECLYRALLAIDKKISGSGKSAYDDKDYHSIIEKRNPPDKRKIRLDLSAASRQKWRYENLYDASGLIARDIVSIYPPGVPALIPGQEIDRTIINSIRQALSDGLSVDGIYNGKIRVIDGRSD